jgi:hypothetical protein
MPLLALALAFASHAHAAEHDKQDKHEKNTDPPEVKVGALVYAHYGYDLTKSADGANSFDLDRAHLSAQSQMTDHLAAKVMLDAGRLDDTSVDTKLRVLVKHAWLEASNGKAIKARFGVVDTGYLSYAEQFVGLRYMGKLMADDHKALSTADIGVNAQGEQAGGMVSWHAALLNGEGYSKPELDAGKTGQARVTVDPLAKKQKFALPITGFVSYAIPAKGNDSVLVYAGAVGVKVPHVVGWVEYVGKSTGGVSSGGISATVSPRMAKYGGIVLRVDRWDPNASASKDASLKISGGLTHDFLEKTAVSLTYERTQPEVGEASHGIFARMQAGF